MNRNIDEILKSKEYSFIKEEPRLKDKIVLLTFGGSIAYGLDTPESDIDIRGIVMPSISDVLGVGYLIDPKEKENDRLVFGKEGFEQVTDTPSDTTIYVLNKIIGLLYKCNPNTIEILGCKPEHYTMVSKEGKLLLDNSELFLSKLAYGSFAGYARAQFQRLKNALGNNSGSNVFQAINLSDSINRMQSHLEREYPQYDKNMIKLYITDKDGNPVTVNGVPVDAYDVGVLFNDVVTEVTVNGKVISDTDVEVRYSINCDKINNRTFMGIFNEVISAIKDFNKHLGNRNHKKDDYHLNKHAMHLIRLYLMALDILNNGEIITYREKEHDFLLSIKTGEYYNETTKSFTAEFFDLVNDFDKKILTAYENTKLPDYPDRDKINKLVMQIMNGYLYDNHFRDITEQSKFTFLGNGLSSTYIPTILSNNGSTGDWFE